MTIVVNKENAVFLYTRFSQLQMTFNGGFPADLEARLKELKNALYEKRFTSANPSHDEVINQYFDSTTNALFDKASETQLKGVFGGDMLEEKGKLELVTDVINQCRQVVGLKMLTVSENPIQAMIAQVASIYTRIYESLLKSANISSPLKQGMEHLYSGLNLGYYDESFLNLITKQIFEAVKNTQEKVGNGSATDAINQCRQTAGLEALTISASPFPALDLAKKNASIILYSVIDPKTNNGHLVMRFSNEVERNKFLNTVGHATIPGNFVNAQVNPHFKNNPQGQTPIVFADEPLEVYMPCYQVATSLDYGVNLVNQELRDKVVHFLGFPLKETKTYQGGQIETIYTTSSTDKNRVFSTFNKAQNTALYFIGKPSPFNEIIFSNSNFYRIEKNAEGVTQKVTFEQGLLQQNIAPKSLQENRQESKGFF